MEKIEVFDRHGIPVQAHRGSLASAFSRPAQQYEGWFSSLRAAHGHDMVQFLEESSLLGEQVMERRRRHSEAC